MSKNSGSPIDVASQLIAATYSRPITPIEVAARKVAGVKIEENVEVDAFTLYELEEIALHLLVYCEAQRKGADDETD